MLDPQTTYVGSCVLHGRRCLKYCDRGKTRPTKPTIIAHANQGNTSLVRETARASPPARKLRYFAKLRPFLEQAYFFAH